MSNQVPMSRLKLLHACGKISGLQQKKKKNWIQENDFIQILVYPIYFHYIMVQLQKTSMIIHFNFYYSIHTKFEPYRVLLV